MKEPSPRGSRIAITSAVVAVLIVGGGGFLLGRSTNEPVQPRPVPVADRPEPTPTAEPTSSGLLDRSDLIALAAAAADAAAAGRDTEAEVAEADGRRFELRLPFGCEGPVDEDSNVGMHWRYDAQDQALRIQITPVIWTSQDWFAGDAAAGVETIEGFWISRPWTSAEGCPPGGAGPAALGAQPVTLPGQTLGVGQVFYADGARGGRRDGKPYRVTVRVPEDELVATQGFRLRLSGRISRAQSDGPVRCQQPAGPEQRPICLVSVVLDEVAIENPATDDTLAIWSLDGRNSPGF